MNGLDELNDWPKKVKTMQKNWIGKSFGCEIDFKIQGNKSIDNIKCFTTRPDTLFGFSFWQFQLIIQFLSFMKQIKNL